MKRAYMCSVVLVFAVALLLPSATVAQQAAKPYHDGPVWEIAFIKAKAGMEDRYLRYLASEWKREQEAMKKAGYVMDYKVIVSEPHGTQDYNVMLMTQYKDMASREANADKMEELGLQLFGSREKIESGYQDRANYREVLASRLGREIVLEPKKK